MTDIVLLAVETATAQLGVAVGDGSGVKASFHVNSHGRHAESLTPAIDFICRTAGVALSSVSAIAVDVGPGLFTGLRVGLATAKAIAFALQIPTVPVSSLDILAFQAQHRGRGRTIVPVIDALSGEVYYRMYTSNAEGIHPTTEAILTTPAQLADDLRGRENAFVVGDGMSFRSVLPSVEIADETLRYPSPATLLQIAASKAARAEFTSAAEIEILYLRKPHVHVKA